MRPLRTALLAVLLVPSLALGQSPRAEGARGAPAGRPAAEGGAPAGAAGGPAGEVAALLAEADALYVRRDAPGAIAGLHDRLDRAEKLAPRDYEVLWRQARLSFWQADDPGLSSEEKSRLGKIAWDYGDRATAADPARVEGWHYAAAGVGNYALGIGVLTALRKGIEGKFKDRLSKAESIDPDFENGAIQTAWGRFWYELPWPKYSADRSRKSLETALRKNPDNVRAHVYLADLDAKQGQPDAAAAELRKALANPPGRYDAPEERRWQDVAKRREADLARVRGLGSAGG